MKQPTSSTANDAELKELAGFGLNFLIGDPEELVRFMRNAGYDPDTLREALETRELELALLSYFAANEPALLAMCANTGVDAARFMRCWSQQNAHL